jgi:poly-gamma-glutamate capsule biosynthesis protein CapA/YwtB (metallophosphatase superfamily)
MASPPPNVPGRWLAAFVLSLATLAASLVLLVVVILDAAASDSSTDLRPGDRPAGTASAAITYRGALPPTLEGLPLRPAGPGEQPDIVFNTGVSGGTVTRYWVPIAALGAGVDALTAEQLQAVVGGTSPNWKQVGGISAPVVFAAAGPERDIASAALFAPSATPQRTFATYEELRAAMTPASGIVAFVPLLEVRFSVRALAVDGTDIVRGRGDPARWPFVERVAISAATGKGRSVVETLAARAAAVLPTATTVVVTGDILQSRCSLARIEATGDWGAALRGPVAEYLAKADLALGSLDGSIQDVSAPFGCISTTNLTSPPQVIEALTLAGIDEVTIATNHVFDCGQAFCGNRAFLRTIELLTQAHIKVAGGGKNLEEALAPVVFELNGTRFGVLGFDDVAAMELEATPTEPGTAPLDDDYKEERAAGEPAFFRPASELSLSRFTERIRALKTQVDVVIVQVQSGTEDTHEPSPRSIKALRAAADAGAGLVVGNQAHWVQAIETRGQAFIAYALGNFIFDQRQTPEHTQGYLLEATFWGKQLANVRMVPYQIADQYKPVFVSGDLRAKILGDVVTASRGLPPP